MTDTLIAILLSIMTFVFIGAMYYYFWKTIRHY